MPLNVSHVSICSVNAGIVVCILWSCSFGLGLGFVTGSDQESANMLMHNFEMALRNLLIAQLSQITTNSIMLCFICCVCICRTVSQDVVEAVNLLAQGKRNYMCGEVGHAVNQLQEACRLLYDSCLLYTSPSPRDS